MSEPPKGSRAPFIIYGGIFLIGAICVSSVLIYDCQRDAPYLDSEPARGLDRVQPPPR